MSPISRTLKRTPLPWLSVLANIESPSTPAKAVDKLLTKGSLSRSLRDYLATSQYTSTQIVNHTSIMAQTCSHSTSHSLARKLGISLVVNHFLVGDSAISESESDNQDSISPDVSGVF